MTVSCLYFLSFSNGGQTSSTCHTTSTSVSIDANGRLAVPSSSVVVANSVVVVAEDRSTCHVTTAGATSSTDEVRMAMAAQRLIYGEKNECMSLALESGALLLDQ